MHASVRGLARTTGYVAPFHYEIPRLHRLDVRMSKFPASRNTGLVMSNLFVYLLQDSGIACFGSLLLQL